jgi:hypothetical protein
VLNQSEPFLSWRQMKVSIAACRPVTR